MRFTTFANAYFEAALFSSTDENDVPLDRIANLRWDPDTYSRLREEIRPFFDAVSWLLEPIAGGDGHAGHDLWLTRNGHGAGFWVGDWDAQFLLEAAMEVFKLGQVDLYVVDNRTVYSVQKVVHASC